MIYRSFKDIFYGDIFARIQLKDAVESFTLSYKKLLQALEGKKKAILSKA